MSTSVTRAVDILELLAESEKPMSLARISAALEIPKSTAHGIVRALIDRRFLLSHEDGSYSIGIKTFEVGSSFVRRSGLTAVIAPQLVSVTRELEVTSHYAVLDGTDAVYLCKEDPPMVGVQLASSLGARLPAHVTAVGKACLAWLPPTDVPGHVALATDGSTEEQMAALTKELEAVHAKGYSTDDGATAAGIRCVAAPVFDVNGPCGAIGVSFLRDTGVANATVVSVVVAAARRTSELLGGKDSA
jgi:DNA-binding IclR family transcriptional regulator